MANYLTITLTGRPPVRIDKDVWPVEAYALLHNGRTSASDADRRWEAFVRRHADGRRIVHGTCIFRGENDRRAGELVGAYADANGADAAVAAALQRVCSNLGNAELAQAVLQDMPARELV